MEFKPMGIKPEADVEEQHEIEDTEPAIQPDPVADAPIQPDVPKEAEETAPDAPPAPPVKAADGDKHMLTYMGNGIWTDQTGKCWCRDKKANCINHTTMSAKELDARPDIKFMIKYGAIKDTIV